MKINELYVFVFTDLVGDGSGSESIVTVQFPGGEMWPLLTGDKNQIDFLKSIAAANFPKDKYEVRTYTFKREA